MSTTTRTKFNGSPSELHELWAKVFGNLTKESDILDLWISCRPLCKTFQKEVEFIFSEKHLPKTWIQFDLGSHLPEEDHLQNAATEFEFDHLSEDKTTAFFKSDINPGSKQRAVFIERFRDYVEAINEEESILKPKHTVQIRHILNDTAIPKLSVNYETLELSCDWRGLVSALLSEESRVNDLQARWAEVDDGVGKQAKEKIQRGEMTLEQAILWAVDSYGKQHDLGIIDARRERIGRQMKRCHSENGDTRNLDWLEYYPHNLDKLKQSREMIGTYEFSDEEESASEEGEEDEDEDDDEWEDEDGEGEDEDED